MLQTKLRTQDELCFGLSLMPYLGEGNVSVSPTSIRTALAMLAEGAKGETLEQIANASGIPLDAKARRQFFERAMKLLNATNAPYKLRCANGVWTEKQYRINKDFKKTLENSYLAEAREADFRGNSEAERQIINAWVSDKTEKKIPELFREDSITSDTILALANALYFKAPWENKFDEKYTKQQQFTLANGKKVQVHMMRKGSVDSSYDLPEFGYGELGKIQIAQLPYEGRDLIKFVILPQKGTSMVDLEEELRDRNTSVRDLQNLMRNSEFVRLELPKHELKGSYDLKIPLVGIGIDRIFSAETAELSGIGKGPLYVSSGVHKTYFKTNEEGSEGAAATGIAVNLECCIREQPPRIEFVADRPFLEAIVHPRSGSCLFVNRVEDPR